MSSVASTSSATSSSASSLDDRDLDVEYDNKHDEKDGKEEKKDALANVNLASDQSTKAVITREVLDRAERALSAQVPISVRVYADVPDSFSAGKDMGLFYYTKDQYGGPKPNILAPEGKSADDPQLQTPVCCIDSKATTTLLSEAVNMGSVFVEAADSKEDREARQTKTKVKYAKRPKIEVRLVDSRKAEEWVLTVVREWLMAVKSYVTTTPKDKKPIRERLGIREELWNSKTFETMSFQEAREIIAKVANDVSDVCKLPFRLRGPEILVYASAPLVSGKKQIGTTPLMSVDDVDREVVPFIRPSDKRKPFHDIIADLSTRSRGLPHIFYKGMQPGKQGLQPVPVFEQRLDAGDLVILDVAFRLENFGHQKCMLYFDWRGTTMLYPNGTYIDTVSEHKASEGADVALNGIEIPGLPFMKPAAKLVLDSVAVDESIFDTDKTSTSAKKSKRRGGESAEEEEEDDGLGASGPVSKKARPAGKKKQQQQKGKEEDNDEEVDV